MRAAADAVHAEHPDLDVRQGKDAIADRDLLAARCPPAPSGNHDRSSHPWLTSVAGGDVPMHPVLEPRDAHKEQDS